MKICLGAQSFASKKHAKVHVSRILSGLVGWEVRESSEHFELLMGLYRRSQTHESVISHFLIIEKFGRVGVRAVTGEGKMIDWSLRSAIAGGDVTMWGKLTGAMRNSIRAQTKKFKAESNGRCALCDAGGFMEADHYGIQFKDLMREYLASRGYFPSSYDYELVGWVFKPEDQGFEQGWQEFYLKLCSLRLLCHSCHLTVTKGQRLDLESE